MRKRFAVCLAGVLALAAGGSVDGQTTTAGAPQTATSATTAQGRAVGEVVSVDASARQVTIRTDEGKSVSISAGEQTSITRVPPGAAAADKAVKIPLAEITVGERLFARGVESADGASIAARQIVVTSRAAGAATAQAGSNDAQQPGRTVFGRITALNPAKREIQLATRTREGAETLTVTAPSDAARIRRYAPDSLDIKNAVAASFNELRVGEQLRATGERSADGTRFTAEEVVAGSVLRVGGIVTAVNSATGELRIKTEQTGQTHTIHIGKRSMLRRIPAELSASLSEGRGERRERREGETAAEGGANAEARAARREARRNSSGSGESGANPQAGGERRRGGGGGRNLMQMLENLPAITLDEIKKGDAVLVTGTTSGQDESQLTAVALVTGDPAFLSRLNQFQGRGTRRNGQNPSPGLPGDVIGGGLPTPREPPRN